MLYIVLKLSLQRDDHLFYNSPAIVGVEVVLATTDKVAADEMAAKLGGPINDNDVCQAQAGAVKTV